MRNETLHLERLDGALSGSCLRSSCLSVAILVNFILQPNLFARDTLNSNMRVFLPIILLTAGQAIVILGGGIDISVGAIVSIVNTILATRVGLEGSPEAMWQYVAISLLVGFWPGRSTAFLSPICACSRSSPPTPPVSFMRGFALFILPNPGGGIPAAIAELYRSTSPLGLPLAFYVIAHRAGLWWYIRSTRYGNFLFAVGGKAQAAYETAVPVTWVQFSTYVISGLMAAFSGIAITMLSGSGNAEIGAAMTLNSITAVVIGGNAMSGGVGGVAGPMMGAITLGLIQNIISFAGIDTWWETLVKATIIVVALATPGDHQPVQEARHETLLHLPPGGGAAPGNCAVLAFGAAAQRLWQRCEGGHRPGDQYPAPGGLPGRDCRRADPGHHQRLRRHRSLRRFGGHPDRHPDLCLSSAAQNEKVLLALLISLAVGAVIGFLNGAAITFLKISPFVMTLGMSGVVTGAMIVINHGNVSGKVAPIMTRLIARPISPAIPIPSAIIIWFIFGVLMWLLLERTTFGKNLFAIGVNRVTAKLSGVNVTGMNLATYALAGRAGRVWRFPGGWQYRSGVHRPGAAVSVPLDRGGGSGRDAAFRRQGQLLGHHGRRDCADPDHQPADHHADARIRSAGWCWARHCWF